MAPIGDDDNFGEVLNTRNVDNVGIEIDRDVSRNENNKQQCQFLKNDKANNKYLQPLLCQ